MGWENMLTVDLTLILSVGLDGSDDTSKGQFTVWCLRMPKTQSIAHAKFYRIGQTSIWTPLRDIAHLEVLVVLLQLHRRSLVRFRSLCSGTEMCQ